jgi:hypothetical protein
MSSVAKCPVWDESGGDRENSGGGQSDLLLVAVRPDPVHQVNGHKTHQNRSYTAGEDESIEHLTERLGCLEEIRE